MRNRGTPWRRGFHPGAMINRHFLPRYTGQERIGIGGYLPALDVGHQVGYIGNPAIRARMHLVGVCRRNNKGKLAVFLAAEIPCHKTRILPNLFSFRIGEQAIQISAHPVFHRIGGQR